MTIILYLDMDGVLVDFESALPKVPADTLAKYAGHPDDIPGLFSLMNPMPGAVEAYLQLSAYFDTYLLSTAPWENPSAWADKLLWVKRYLGKPATKRLIITHHKELNRGDFLVDDRTRHGADRFLGEHIHFGTPRFPDWSVVLPYLLERAG
jgi:5'-nucleotidase